MAMTRRQRFILLILILTFVPAWIRWLWQEPAQQTSGYDLVREQIRMESLIQ